jgi:hypothetical protein
MQVRSNFVQLINGENVILNGHHMSGIDGSRHNSQHTDRSTRGSVLSFSPEPINEAVEKIKHLLIADY